MILQDHKKDGKKFIPPMKHMMNFTEVHYVERILPEIAWIAFLIDNLGARQGIHIASRLVITAHSLHVGNAMCDFSLISAFSLLTEDEKSRLIETIREENVLFKLRNALAVFFRVYPSNNPLAFITEGTPSTPSAIDLSVTKRIIHKNIDRRDFDAVVTQSVVFYSKYLSGKLKFNTEVKAPDLESIIGDFQSAAAQRAASHIRMAVNTVFMFNEKDIGTKWASYFWNHGLELEPPIPFLVPQELESADDSVHPAETFALEYEKIVITFLNEVWNSLPKDLLESQVAEVIGALLSRQAYMSVKLSNNMDIWDWSIGPLILRSMTDCFITLAWILKDPILRSKQYISYGLGQQKLSIEHFKEQLSKELDEESKKSLQSIIDNQESWLNAQHYEFLQEVDVGSWSGLSTRDMAKQCDAMNLYHFAYTPYSACTHNIWSHTGMFNCRHSTNPLHKFIRTPCFVETEVDLSVFLNSAKYLEKCFTAVVESFNLHIEAERPYSWAANNIVSLGKTLREYYEKNAKKDERQMSSECTPLDQQSS